MVPGITLKPCIPMWSISVVVVVVVQNILGEGQDLAGHHTIVIAASD